MSKYFSKSTNGFYDTEINGKNIPSDAVQITFEKYQELFENQSNGQIITSDANGYPINTQKPEPTADEIATQTAKENAKLSAIAKLTALGLTTTDLEALGIK